MVNNFPNLQRQPLCWILADVLYSHINGVAGLYRLLEKKTPQKTYSFSHWLLMASRGVVGHMHGKTYLRISLADISQLSCKAFPNLYSQMQAMIVKYSMMMK